MIKQCAHCGRQFEATCNRAKFCEECRPIARREYQRQYRERFNANHRVYYRRRKLKLIREILSAAKEIVHRD